MAVRRASSNARVSKRQVPAGAKTSVIPVVREEVTVRKRVREKGKVVVHVTPRVKLQDVDVPLVDETVEVERVTINRQVDAPSPPRVEGDVTIVPVYEEILVVEKRLVLKQEIRITRRSTVHHERRKVELRSEEAHVLRSNGSPS
jgi:stress response protein YsnF